jgi:hypothetical protein
VGCSFPCGCHSHLLLSLFLGIWCYCEWNCFLSQSVNISVISFSILSEWYFYLLKEIKKWACVAHLNVWFEIHNYYTTKFDELGPISMAGLHTGHKAVNKMSNLMKSTGKWQHWNSISKYKTKSDKFVLLELGCHEQG